MSFMPLLLPASFWLLSPYLSIAYSWKSYKQNITVYIVLCLPSFPQSNGFWDSNISFHQSLKVGKMYVDPLVVSFYCRTWLSSSCPIGIGCYIKEGLGEGAGLDENPSQYQNLETQSLRGGPKQNWEVSKFIFGACSICFGLPGPFHFPLLSQIGIIWLLLGDYLLNTWGILPFQSIYTFCNF